MSDCSVRKKGQKYELLNSTEIYSSGCTCAFCPAHTLSLSFGRIYIYRSSDLRLNAVISGKVHDNAVTCSQSLRTWATRAQSRPSLYFATRGTIYTCTVYTDSRLLQVPLQAGGRTLCAICHTAHQ